MCARLQNLWFKDLNLISGDSFDKKNSFPKLLKVWKTVQAFINFYKSIFSMKMPPRKLSTGKREITNPSDPHYIEKRSKNNDAVKKSREKTRQKAKETMEKVSQLKQVCLEEENNLNAFLFIFTFFRKMKC